MFDDDAQHSLIHYDMPLKTILRGIFFIKILSFTKPVDINFLRQLTMQFFIIEKDYFEKEI